jgi:hypothetical protein
MFMFMLAFAFGVGIGIGVGVGVVGLLPLISMMLMLMLMLMLKLRKTRGMFASRDSYERRPAPPNWRVVTSDGTVFKRNAKGGSRFEKERGEGGKKKYNN